MKQGSRNPPREVSELAASLKHWEPSTWSSPASTESWSLKGTHDTALPAGGGQKASRAAQQSGAGSAANREAHGGRWRPSVLQSNHMWDLPEPSSPHASKGPPVIPGALNTAGLFPTPVSPKQPH